MGIVERIASLFQGYNFLIIPAAFLSISVHEVCHGYIAFLLGDRTAKDSGRLSLNPFAHFDLIGLICMILFGFGWAKAVPINPLYFKRKKLGITLVSFVGPVSNLLMAFVSVFLAFVCMLFEVESSVFMYLQELFLTFFFVLAILNIGLALFNLLPIPPLDGSKILFALLPSRAYGFILKYERYGFLLLLALINIPGAMISLDYAKTAVFLGMTTFFSSIFM